MGNRRKARELAVQILFNMEFNPGDPDEICDLVYENFSPSRSIRVFSRKLVCGVRENIQCLDSMIKSSSKNWRLERMSVVDRNILRLASYEILFMEDIPYKVSIDEAVELGKKFGAEESGGFINGILDNILKNITLSKSS
jgi:transcription antitermination factor NusB